MSKQDEKQSLSSRAGFRVNRSVSPGSEQALAMTVTSGQKCLESYKNSSPLGLLVKTCLESSMWHSTKCLLTWREKVTKSNVSLFRLAVSTPLIKEKDALLWPTPSTGAALCGGTGNFKTLQKMAEKGLITEEERKSFSQGNGGNTNPELMEWLMGYEKRFTELIPTPTATDYKGGITDRVWMPNSQTVHVERERESKYRGLLRELAENTPRGKIGYLNPDWIEWLMGYPIGLTDLNA